MESGILQIKCTSNEDSQRLASNTSPKDMLSSAGAFLFTREVTMKVYKELNQVMRAGARITRDELSKQNDAGAILALCVALAGLIFVVAIFVNFLVLGG